MIEPMSGLVGDGNVGAVQIEGGAKSRRAHAVKLHGADFIPEGPRPRAQVPHDIPPLVVDVVVRRLIGGKMHGWGGIRTRFGRSGGLSGAITGEEQE